MRVKDQKTVPTLETSDTANLEQESRDTNAAQSQDFQTKRKARPNKVANERNARHQLPDTEMQKASFHSDAGHALSPALGFKALGFEALGFKALLRPVAPVLCSNSLNSGLL